MIVLVGKESLGWKGMGVSVFIAMLLAFLHLAAFHLGSFLLHMPFNLPCLKTLLPGVFQVGQKNFKGYEIY